jgi:aryl-alcohol dehydrogenase-like predicted oxidoreductase
MTNAIRIGLPGTDLIVSRLCLGGNRLGAQLDRDASFALLDAFVARGGTFVDTAHVYADWLPDAERSCSEKTIGRWLSARGVAKDVVVATKIGHSPLTTPHVRRLDRNSLRTDIEESLTNLGLSSLDLVYLHRDDPDLPAEEILEALEGFRAEGLIRYYGASNWSAARLMQAQESARRRGWLGFSANQAEWSLAKRNAGSAPADLFAMDAAMLDWHVRYGVAAVPYSAQAKGFFDKALGGSLDEAMREAYDSDTNRRKAASVAEAARRCGATPTEVALHVLTRAPVATIPVIGPRTPEQLESSFRSLTLNLSDADVERLLT